MNNDLISREALIEAVEDMYEYAELGEVIDVIKNAPTFTPKVEFVTKNGITFPKALETMTYSHELTTEERQNIERAYMLGVYSNARPHGKWEEDWQEDLDFMSRKGWKCPFCKWRTTYGTPNFCMNCGADMREDSGK